MESCKLATALTIMVLMAFTSSGTMAQEFGAAPAPSPSMESAGMALQVPALLAAIASLSGRQWPNGVEELGAAPAPSPSMESAGMALQVPALLAAVVSFVAYSFF
ncbi:hypothetical protein L1987_06098 [Smallanthus sonchifolius]|uniref:Uncharacterized protein n=1 Tax=Smallanthus sonchifolius TaxID=185202 RepID=A0ACB9JXE2_9ASTR|nr:hypothetical protein L1987_06098 [Smallanthus sonchifolius]